MSQCGDVDTFEHVLNVTAQNDSIYAYYYMDEDDKTVRTKDIKDCFLYRD